MPQIDGGSTKLWQTDRSLQFIFQVSAEVVRFWSAFGFEIRSFQAFEIMDLPVLYTILNSIKFNQHN